MEAASAEQRDDANTAAAPAARPGASAAVEIAAVGMAEKEPTRASGAETAGMSAWAG